jgi:hypothetical protein
MSNLAPAIRVSVVKLILWLSKERRKRMRKHRRNHFIQEKEKFEDI